LNNTEYITIDDPASGNYKISVEGFHVITNQQVFHVAYWFDFSDTFEWTYPTAKDRADLNKDIYFRWTTTYDTNAQLEISVNNNSYREIDADVNLAGGFYQWHPMVEAGKAVARMTIGGETFISDTFTISKPINVSVAFNCSNDAMITWNKVVGASGYAVYELGEKYLELVANVPDTIFSFVKRTENYMAVAPLFKNKIGLLSETYNIETQGTGCYFNSFSAQSEGKGTAKLILNLSTLLNVQEIIFSKWNGDAFVELNAQDISTGLQYVFNDSSLKSGVTEYAAFIILNDGQKISTDTALVYYGDETTFIIFPNPVKVTEEIQILSDGDDLEIIFYDATGKAVKQQQLLTSLFKFHLNDLISGFYLYRIFRGGNPIFSGRLVIN
jgi:hypothetical protein